MDEGKRNLGAYYLFYVNKRKSGIRAISGLFWETIMSASGYHHFAKFYFFLFLSRLSRKKNPERIVIKLLCIFHS